mgnify:FL=1
MNESEKDKMLDSAYATFEIEAESLRATGEVLDRTEFEKAVDMLASAERIAASGCGHSGIACRHFAHLCCCIERPARFLSPSEAVHGGLGYICPGDVMMLASRGGETDELVPIAKICRAKGASVILVTEKPDSTLGRLSDIILRIAVTRECDRDNCQGTTSFAVTSAVFDALSTALIERLDYSSREFAVIHPNGAVGKRLNSK